MKTAPGGLLVLHPAAPSIPYPSAERTASERARCAGYSTGCSGSRVRGDTASRARTPLAAARSYLRILLKTYSHEIPWLEKSMHFSSTRPRGVMLTKPTIAMNRDYPKGRRVQFSGQQSKSTIDLRDSNICRADVRPSEATTGSLNRVRKTGQQRCLAPLPR